MGKKLYEMVNKAGQVIGYMFECPGCKEHHAVHVTEPNSLGAIWKFNDDMEQPTFSPSLLQKFQRTNYPKQVCHLFVRDGICEFLGDCTHELAGKKIPLPDIEERIDESTRTT